MSKTQDVRSTTCLTFSIPGEDHTIGNALRANLSKRIDCEFCGYCMPHPTKKEMNFRLQTLERPAMDVFCDSLDDLKIVFSHIADVFEDRVKTFTENQMQD